MRGEIVEFLDILEQGGKRPQQACRTMFFLIPKNVTSERPIALMPTAEVSSGLGADMEERSKRCGRLMLGDGEVQI